MQYTANKPYNSVLIIQPSGLRYRLQEDHVFKEIRYTQVTGVKIKKDFFLLLMGYIIAPLQLLFFIYLSYDQGLSWPIGIELIFWGGYLCSYFFIPINFTVVIKRGSLASDVFMTPRLSQAKAIKKEIESHL